MNNKLIKESIVIMRTCRFMWLLTGMLLLLSCGDKGNDDSTGNNVGDASGEYLMLHQNGLNEVMVSGSKENYTFPLTIKRVGTNMDSETQAKIEPWGEKDLDAYNDKQKSTYTLLPESMYSLTTKDLNFGSGNSRIDVEIKFNPSQIYSELKKENAHYIIALRLKSDGVKVKDRQRDVLLSLSIDYPKVALASSNGKRIDLNSGITNVSVAASLTSQLNGEAINSWWNLNCKLSVPENADELVVAYNAQHNTDYDLLPSNSYNLGEGFIFKEGSSQSLGTFTISQRDLEIKYYVLPLQLVGTGNDDVMYDDAIHYVVVARSYTNPIINSNAPDPTVIRAKDGYFYLYATESAIKNVPIYRSKDLVNWAYVGTAFTAKTRPTWEPMTGRAIWAPEIRFINGKYVLYYSWAIWGNQEECHIGVATADSPIGPFVDRGCLINGKEIGVKNSIDQFYIEDNGKKYMFWGSFNGIYATELTDDGLAVKKKTDGKPVLLQKVCNSRFEAVNIYKKGDYYYLLVSIGGCCDGINSSYRVGVGRSRDILGPYVDDQGRGMLDGNFKLVVDNDKSTNNNWVGPGHNSILIQDDAGTEWMIYHGYKVTTVDDGRVVLLDRVQWSSDGWPYIDKIAPSVFDLVPVFN